MSSGTLFHNTTEKYEYLGQSRAGRVILQVPLYPHPPGVYDRYMITDLKAKAMHRSKTLQGQLKGLEKMIECDEYCMDIITQSLAIQKSLASLNKLIVENHLKTHIVDNLASADKVKQQQSIAELLDLYELSNVRGRL